MTQDNNTGDQPPPEPPKRGSMRFQDSNTQPRQPSLAEQRARQQALAQEERNEELARQADAKAATRRKILIGSGVTVGLVGLVATFYTVAKTENVTAVCTDSNGVVQNDDYCDDSYVTSHGGYHSGGFLFLPIPGGGYNSYRYNYGGTGVIGQRVSGGSYDAPSARANVTTKTGKSVQRGGFGISGKSGSTGGSGKSGGS
ncbi:hypothetical protein [Amycolatopsis sp. MtRt-6]|uniref:hypothetical protein n=1 Tax=Amycolatopsis sp. MtRt-6 TaxID=2792782 RepID=UPI001F5CBB59|nr:hypothetical protein [Amycolatopsis sp. MtRt-6]